LSLREREVAALVARGLTNRQIADELVISERTAEGHVERLREKLGVHNRAEVAIWVIQNGVVPASA
jgi:non-specific serine/threonine protein kinase